jgi:hypothetical protein
VGGSPSLRSLASFIHTLQIDAAPVLVYGVAMAMAGALRVESLVMRWCRRSSLPNPFLVNRIARATATSGVARNE